MTTSEICEHCDSTFTPLRSHARFCSANCRAKASQARRRDEERPAGNGNGAARHEAPRRAAMRPPVSELRLPPGRTLRTDAQQHLPRRMFLDNGTEISGDKPPMVTLPKEVPPEASNSAAKELVEQSRAFLEATRGEVDRALEQMTAHRGLSEREIRVVIQECTASIRTRVEELARMGPEWRDFRQLEERVGQVKADAASKGQMDRVLEKLKTQKMQLSEMDQGLTEVIQRQNQLRKEMAEMEEWRQSAEKALLLLLGKRR